MVKADKPGGKGAFYRLMRDWHGYLSAAAFLALLLFAVTGVLLNHPNLLPGPGVPYEDSSVDLTPDQLAEAKASPDPGAFIIDIVEDSTKLVGRYEGANQAGPDLFIRLEGLRGTADLTANMETGRVEVMVSRANAISVLNGLHRGELAGNVWRGVIDVIAGILIVMAILGYILFFSLRYRLKTALIVTGVSLIVLAGAFALFVS